MKEKVMKPSKSQWEEELKRQCEIRNLPYKEVHYLCSEVEQETRADERERIVGIMENMYKKTTDPFEVMIEMRQEEVKHGWVTADTKAGYNQAIKDILSTLKNNK